MVAVVAVFANHVSGHPRGAFTGVDVFFVISGFLITGLLIRDAGSSRMSVGRYFGSFYERRARRILPAALTVLLTSLVAASITFAGNRITEARIDVLWAAGFAANIHSARLGTDYFQQGRAPSITQHFWSLAVEEQFYVVWPVVVLAVVGLLRRRRIALNLTPLLGVILALTVISFVYAMHDSASSPTTAYFSTFARAWELGVGAALAVTLVKFPELNARLGRTRGPLFLLGLAAILASFFVVNPNNGFPAPWGAFPVLATAFVIFIGPTQNAWSAPLTNRATVYLGEISFSLYLWHWPTIIIVTALLAKGSLTYYFVVTFASLALAIFSFEFVETPLRTRRQNRIEGHAGPRKITALLSATLAVIALGGYAMRPVPKSPTFTDNTTFSSARPSTVVNPAIAVPPAKLSEAISNAIEATSFPTLDPPLNQLSIYKAEAEWAPCDGNGTIRETCVFPSASFKAPKSKTVLVLGDSISLAWLPAIRQALIPSGYKIYGIAKQQCSAAYISEDNFNNTNIDSGCQRQHTFYEDAIRRIDPGMVILSSTDATVNYVHGRSGSGALTAYQDGMAKTSRLLAGRREVILSPPPTGDSLDTCDSAAATPSGCVAQINNNWLNQSGADAAVARQFKAQYVDTHLWFCSSAGYCPSFVGRVPVKYDGEHLTQAYSQSLGPELAAALKV